MSDPIKIVIDLKTITCRCGTVYAVPHWVENHWCPLCAGRQMQAATKTEAQLTKELIAKDKTISCLHGALTRAKRRSKR